MPLFIHHMKYFFFSLFLSFTLLGCSNPDPNDPPLLVESIVMSVRDSNTRYDVELINSDGSSRTRLREGGLNAVSQNLILVSSREFRNQVFAVHRDGTINSSFLPLMDTNNEYTASVDISQD